MPNKLDWVYALVKRLHDEGTIDGVGFQTHIALDYPDFADYERAVRAYAALGLTIQSTEMDIRVPAADPATQMKLAVRYRDYFAMMRRLRREGCDIDSITLWGLADDTSWLMGWNGPPTRCSSTVCCARRPPSSARCWIRRSPQPTRT